MIATRARCTYVCLPWYTLQTAQLTFISQECMLQTQPKTEWHASTKHQQPRYFSLMYNESDQGSRNQYWKHYAVRLVAASIVVFVWVVIHYSTSYDNRSTSVFITTAIRSVSCPSCTTMCTSINWAMGKFAAVYYTTSFTRIITNATGVMLMCACRSRTVLVQKICFWCCWVFLGAKNNRGTD